MIFLLRTTTLISVICLLSIYGYSQGLVINDYTPAISLQTSCKNILTVVDASKFNTGDTVLLIQMKGASIDVTNTASFGSITTYGTAGNYEFNYIKGKNGNQLELLNLVSRAYDMVDGKVQLIRVPYFTDYTATSTLSCLPWDGDKGGVLVFNVQNNLVLNADIDVSGKGYAGGAGANTGMLMTNCFTDNYSYPSTSMVAANKGESIVVVNNNISRGKGTYAAGGGGGLDHNSGGGGGGNGGSGGFGGYQLEPCGNAPFDNRGIGGRNLDYTGALNKIFMGSGGGAGHANNPANISMPPTGGNGGAIIIISALNLRSNSFKIKSNGTNALGCTGPDCHDGMGGGGAGGTILLNIPTITDNTVVEVKGGVGADMTGPAPTGGRLGPGGGGGGGVLWVANAVMPANIAANLTGGMNGVIPTDNNSAWGATQGSDGISLVNLQMPATGVLFKPNIDSVRMRATVISCNTVDFEGLGFVNTNPVASWQWDFGDGNTGNTQNITHNYLTSNTYTIKLVITDVNGCKDSVSTTMSVSGPKVDFEYKIDICDPLTAFFTGMGTSIINPYWDFGAGNVVTGLASVTHSFVAQGNYFVKFATGIAGCSDTIQKMIRIGAENDNIIITNDTTICYGVEAQLRAVPSLEFCWTPSTYLDNPHSLNPVTSATEDITYYLTSQIVGGNIIQNGDFSQGNTGFTSGYVYSPASGFNEGLYNVGSSITAWHPGMTPCQDHTSGNGNMLMVNGSSQLGVKVWSQTVSVQPNTNYAFSTWLQHITTINPARLQFFINGYLLGNVFAANNVSCVWDNFFATWNSGNETTATISIVNQNQVFSGNDFALDDISFAPVIVKRDSVKIIVDKPVVRASNDTIVCLKSPVQLLASGAQNFTWVPAVGLNNPLINNPVSIPASTIEYIVTGTTINGCIDKDTVNVAIFPLPVISTTNDTTICKNTSLQLSASGGVGYAWSPQNTLNDPAISNPIASPVSFTKYQVLITDNNSCTFEDSVKVSIRPDPVFTINAAASICEMDSIQLQASGGDIYTWQPSLSMDDPTVGNPIVFPSVSTTYTVNILEMACNNTATLSTDIEVRELPIVRASKSNDIDCSNVFSQLNATGAVSYVWLPSGSLSSTLISNPIATPVVPTTYVVEGKDVSGCVNSDTVVVDVKNINKGGYLLPNAFTPNNDGLNDCYGVKYWGIIENIEFSIFNRWGERIFYATNPSACWDGTYKGVKQNAGVFIYMIKAKTNCEEAVFRKGTFVLIR